MARSLFARLRRRFGTPSSGSDRREQVHELWTAVKEDPAEQTAQSRSLEIVVVGGGFAGLCAGHYLSLEGHKVTVLEARDRVGGRVHSLRDFAAEQTIEGGAELIGTNHQLWMKLAIEFGLSFDVVTSDDLYSGAGLHEPLWINGRDVDSKHAELLHNWMDKIFDELTDLASGVDSKCPWLSENAQGLDSTPLSRWLDEAVKRRHLDHEYAALLRGALEFEFSNNNAVSTDHQSLLGLLAMIKGGGGKKYWDMSEVFRCSQGNDALATALEKSIVNRGGSVLKNTPVVAIQFEPLDATHKASVSTSDRTYDADAVILAIPPSVWGSIKMEEKVAADHASQMGVATKYLSSLKSRFWVKDSLAPSGSIDQIGMIWEGSDNQSWRAGKEVELTVFSGANTARKLVDMGEAERDAFYEKFLNATFKEHFTPHHVRSRFMCWPKEPWTMAGYSFPNVGEVCTKIRALNCIYHETMVFAGEHTCLAFVGYMEGALQSGRNAAMKIRKMAH